MNNNKQRLQTLKDIEVINQKALNAQAEIFCLIKGMQGVTFFTIQQKLDYLNKETKRLQKFVEKAAINELAVV